MTNFNPKNPTKFRGTNKFITFFVSRNRQPTGADYRQPETGTLYSVGTVWQVGVNPTTGVEGELWMLSKIVANVAYWIQVQANVAIAEQFTTNIGGPVVPDGSDNIFLNASVTTFTDGTVANTIKTEVQAANHLLIVGRGTNIAAGTITAGAQGTVLAQNTVGADAVFSRTVLGDANFTYLAFTSGVGQFLVAESDFTASGSNAGLVASCVAGAGIPLVGATITASRFFAYSIDQSLSDSWFLRTGANSNMTGGTTLMSMTIAGQQNLPLQSSGATQSNSTQANATGDGTQVTLICPGEYYDQNNEYNTTTGVMTAKQQGKYQFNVTVAMGDLGAAHTGCTIVLQVGTAPATITLWQGNPGANRDASNIFVISGACQMVMQAGDTARVFVTVSGGTKVVDLLGAPSNTPPFCSFSFSMIA